MTKSSRESSSSSSPSSNSSRSSSSTNSDHTSSEEEERKRKKDRRSKRPRKKDKGSESEDESDELEKRRKQVKHEGKGKSSTPALPQKEKKPPAKEEVPEMEESDSEVEVIPNQERGEKSKSPRTFTSARAAPPKVTIDDKDKKSSNVKSQMGTTGADLRSILKKPTAEVNTEKREPQCSTSAKGPKDDDGDVSLLDDNEKREIEAMGKDELTLAAEALQKYPAYNKIEVRACSWYNQIRGCRKHWNEDHGNKDIRPNERRVMILHCCEVCLRIGRSTEMHSKWDQNCRFYKLLDSRRQ